MGVGRRECCGGMPSVGLPGSCTSWDTSLRWQALARPRMLFRPWREVTEQQSDSHLRAFFSPFLTFGRNAEPVVPSVQNARLPGCSWAEVYFPLTACLLCFGTCGLQRWHQIPLFFLFLSLWASCIITLVEEKEIGKFIKSGFAMRCGFVRSACTHLCLQL